MTEGAIEQILIDAGYEEDQAKAIYEGVLKKVKVSQDEILSFVSDKKTRTYTVEFKSKGQVNIYQLGHGTLNILKKSVK